MTGWGRRRLLRAAPAGVLLASGAPRALAQAGKPIRIGFSIAQTGPLRAAGKSGLLARQIWRDDVNTKGGLLGRPVELVVYGDQGNADKNLGQFRAAGKQVLVAPDAYRTGELRAFNSLRK